MSSVLEPGTSAPDFTLHVTPDQSLSLRELHGRRLRLRRLLANPLFKLFDNRQKIAGLERFHDDTVSADTFGFFRFVRFHLAHGEQHRRLQRGYGAAYFFADFQPAVARHVDIEDDDVRFLFSDLFDRSCAVANRYYFITGVREDLTPHVLGGHTVIGK